MTLFTSLDSYCVYSEGKSATYNQMEFLFFFLNEFSVFHAYLLQQLVWDRVSLSLWFASCGTPWTLVHIVGTPCLYSAVAWAGMKLLGCGREWGGSDFGLWKLLCWKWSGCLAEHGGVGHRGPAVTVYAHCVTDSILMLNKYRLSNVAYIY